MAQHDDQLLILPPRITVVLGPGIPRSGACRIEVLIEKIFCPTTPWAGRR
jgi:hypothetical protein